MYAWSQHQAEAIRAQRWDALDREHLADEVASLHQSDLHTLDLYLLGCVEVAYGEPKDVDAGGEGHFYYWQSAVLDHHQRMLELSLEDSPSLRPHLAARLPKAYAYARAVFLRRQTPPRVMPPEQCPWTFAQLTTACFWPPEAPQRLP